MLPEISRRCLSCGAAARAGSRFCPQCGNALEAEAAARVSVPPTGEWALPSAEESPRAEDWTPPTNEFAAFEQTPAAAGARAESAEPLPVAAAPADVEVGPGAPVASAPESLEEAMPEPEDAGRAGDVRGRVARVREGTRARVGRMREEAIVVLEETPDDSGLRFVLAAAALFVGTLVLLFLSTTILR